MSRTAHPVSYKVWVCESCGAVWHAGRDERPPRDVDGRVLCETCATYAGIARRSRTTPAFGDYPAQTIRPNREHL